MTHERTAYIQDAALVFGMIIDGMHQSKKKAVSSESVGFKDTDFEVAEWLEAERLENDKRMQAIGCGGSSRKSDESH